MSFDILTYPTNYVANYCACFLASLYKIGGFNTVKNKSKFNFHWHTWFIFSIVFTSIWIETYNQRILIMQKKSLYDWIQKNCLHICNCSLWLIFFPWSLLPSRLCFYFYCVLLSVSLSIVSTVWLLL